MSAFIEPNSGDVDLLNHINDIVLPEGHKVIAILIKSPRGNELICAGEFSIEALQAIMHKMNSAYRVAVGKRVS